MGHLFGGGFLKATTKEAAMREGYTNAQEFAFRNVDREENHGGHYDNSFRFYDRVFDTEEEAKDFFDSLGSYCDGVCMVKHATTSARNRLNKVRAKVQTKKAEMHKKAIEEFKKRTSASIGCKKCGTRIKSDIALQRNLICPNCRNWLVSDSYKACYAKLDEMLQLAEEQFQKDCAENGKPRYWAKYEIHT